MTVAFVTGFPGFLARWWVRKWLSASDDARIVALVLPEERAAAERHLDALLGLESRDLAPTRVELVVGDVRRPGLGMSPELRGELAQSVTEVHHLAAQLFGEPKAMEQVNVRGTEHVLAFAASCRTLERFVHYSSAYVCGRRSGVVMEDELEQGQSFRNAYEATKYRAEQRVRAAPAGLPWLVIRPAGVVGDTLTGHSDRCESIYHLALFLAALPSGLSPPTMGDGGAPLHILPVDHLIDAVHVIASRPDAIGKTFHVVDPNPIPVPIPVRRAFEAVAERIGRKLSRYEVPAPIGKALLRLPGLERWSSISPDSIDYASAMVFFNSKNTRDALTGTGMRPPQLEDYLDVLVQHALRPNP